MDINESTKTALIRKGNELFNSRDIEGAYRCYKTSSYYSGIERIADYYYFTENNIIKAYRLYKQILREDSNLGGNVRAKKKIDEICISIVKIIRKWLKEDEEINKKESAPKRQYYASVNKNTEKFYIQENSSKQEK